MNWIKKDPGQLLVYIVSFLFFLCTLVSNFSGPHDSITYLNCIVKGHPLVNQHHLLYHPLARYWLLLWQPVFPGVKDYFIVEVFTALWGSGSLVVVYNFFRKRFLLPVSTSVTGLLVVAFSYGFWFYSVNIEVYAPPLFFLLLSLYIITKPDFGKKDVWKVIALHILSILFHQINILFAVIVLYKFWIERERINFGRSVWQYAVAGILIIGGAYYLVGWVIEGQNTLSAWVKWIEGYSQNDVYWHALNAKTPIDAAIGYSHAFIGGHFFFQIPPVHAYINHSLAVHSLNDELFLSRKISPHFAIVLGVLTLVLMGVMLLLIIRFFRKYKTIVQNSKKLIIPLVLCGVIYSIFFCFWMPEILEFWIFQTVLLWLLLIGTLPITKFPFKLNNTAGVLIIALLLLIINFFGSMRFMLNVENDLYYYKVKPLMNEVKENDMVLLEDAWILKDFMEYFTHATNVQAAPSKESMIPAVDKAVNECIQRGGRIFIYPETNNMKAAPNFRYVDSLLNVFHNRQHIFREADPKIILIE